MRGVDSLDLTGIDDVIFNVPSQLIGRSGSSSLITSLRMRLRRALFCALAATSTSTTVSGPTAARMAARREISAVLWDLDGTLLDTETLSSEAIQAVLSDCGATLEWELKKTLMGLPGSVWPAMVVDAYALQGRLSPADLLQRWETNMAGMSERIQKMDGALEAVEHFHRLNVPMGIATSSSRLSVEKKALQHGDIFGKMRVVVTGDDPTVRHGKPAPDIFIEAANRLGVAPAKCLIFEDSLSGVEAALRAGAFCVAVPDARLDPGPFQNLFASHNGRGMLSGSLKDVSWADFHIDI